MLISKKGSTLKIPDYCKWPPEIMTVLVSMAASVALKLKYALNRSICEIHCILAIHGCKCCSKINTLSIKEWMGTTNFVN